MYVCSVNSIGELFFHHFRQHIHVSAEIYHCYFHENNDCQTVYLRIREHLNCLLIRLVRCEKKRVVTKKKKYCLCAKGIIIILLPGKL